MAMIMSYENRCRKTMIILICNCKNTFHPSRREPLHRLNGLWCIGDPSKIVVVIFRYSSSVATWQARKSLEISNKSSSIWPVTTKPVQRPELFLRLAPIRSRPSKSGCPRSMLSSQRSRFRTGITRSATTKDWP